MQTQALFPSSGEFSAAQRFVGLVMCTQDKNNCLNYSVLFAMMYSGIYMQVCDWGGGEGGGERGGGHG